MSSPYQTSWDTSALSDGQYDLRVITTDNAYRYGFPRFDHTRTPLTESAIEFVLNKL